VLHGGWYLFSEYYEARDGFLRPSRSALGDEGLQDPGASVMYHNICVNQTGTAPCCCLEPLLTVFWLAGCYDRAQRKEKHERAQIRHLLFKFLLRTTPNMLMPQTFMQRALSSRLTRKAVECGQFKSSQLFRMLIMGNEGGRRPLSSLSSSSMTYPEGWAAAAEKELKGKKPLDSLLFHTPEEITIKPVYGAHDLKGIEIDQGKRNMRLSQARGSRIPRSCLLPGKRLNTTLHSYVKQLRVHFHIVAAPMPRCTRRGRGPSGSTQASRLLKSPTPFIASECNRGR
jgi:hypothetical protein